ncbi:MAG TPA: HAD-IIIA family hydrolase [Flavobacteriales bacterium]|nr:HAD-IIIA family hydrolase [Flavobacteriales bacterium]
MHSNKAIFFDRDGVLVHEDGEYTFTRQKLRINQNVPEFLAEVKKRGYLLFVITNQGGVGKGLYTKKEVAEMHTILAAEFEKAGVKMEKYLVCAHHPVSSNCLCRKPGSLLLERAIALYNLDVKASYLIGDRERDVQAAQRAGINPILITSNSSLFTILDKVKP